MIMQATAHSTDRSIRPVADPGHHPLQHPHAADNLNRGGTGYCRARGLHTRDTTRFRGQGVNALRNAARASSLSPLAHASRPTTPHVARQQPGLSNDRGVLISPPAWLAATGYVGQLDLPRPRGSALQNQLDQVPLADLCVVEVQVHPEMGVVRSHSTRASVSAARANGVPGWSTGVVQVLQGEDHVVPFAEVGDPGPACRWAASHMSPVTTPFGLIGRPRPSSPVPCRLRVGEPRYAGRLDGPLGSLGAGCRHRRGRSGRPRRTPSSR